MSNAKKLPELEFSGNVSEKWKLWKQKFEIYMRVTKGYKETAEDQVATLLNAVGDEGLSIYNTFEIPVADKNNLDVILQKFEAYCAPRKNLVYEQSVFFGCSQLEGEKFDHYLTRLKILAGSCEFGSQQKQLLTLRVVMGISDTSMKERLLRVNDLTLEKAADYCRAAEASKIQAMAMEENKSLVEVVKKVEGHADQVQTGSRGHRVKYEDRRMSKSIQAEAQEYNCKKCGYRHVPRTCPAFRKKCKICNEENHFAKMCKQRKVAECAVNIKEPESEDEHNSELYVSSITKQDKDNKVIIPNITKLDDFSQEINAVNVKSGPKEWVENIHVEGHRLLCKIDTGAETSIMPLNEFNNLKLKVSMSKTNVILVAFGEGKIYPKGKVTLNCKGNNETPVGVEFMVTEMKCKPMLGLEASIKLGLIKQMPVFINKVEMNPVNEGIGSRKQVVEKYQDVFKGLGCMPGKHKIILEPDHVPVIQPPRKIPLALQDRLKTTIQSLEEKGVVEKVTKPTNWANNLVIVEKPNGSLRLCLDPIDLNKAIKRQHYPIPSADEVLVNLVGKKYFSIVDMREGFWQVQLHEDSSDLCTFNTPEGRYKFLRMPYGIKSAPEVFQRRNIENFGDIENVQVIFDDIIVSGKSIQEHDTALIALFERAKQLNITFNVDKFQYRVSEVRYMGHILTSSGLRPDPERIRAIEEMPDPTNTTELRRFMGMVNYVGQFIPNLSELSAPLRNLLKKETQWQWNHEQAESLRLIKVRLSTAPVLTYFDTNKQAILQVDASKSGLGACLLQDGKPIAYSSRSMTATEQQYPQIEKELLSVVFGTEKFHYFLYGRRVIVHTDHKPLISILSKNVNRVSPRLQRMQLKLLKYDLQLEYLSGPKMFVADTLSRAYLPETGISDPEMEVLVHTVSKYLPMSHEKREQFQKAINEDETANILKELYMTGWPKYKDQVHPAAKFFWNYRHELSFHDGLVFIGSRVLVPPSLKSAMLELVHGGHMGEEKTKNRARQVLFWPNMTKDIEEYVKCCKTCERFRKSNAKEPLIPHPIPHRPWEVVGADVLEYRGDNFLVIKDYYSKWIELIKLNSKTAKELIGKFKAIFSRQGIPNRLISDNMPFSSFEFRAFAQEWGFETTTSSPTFAQANGMAENGVKIAKMMLKKAHHLQSDVYLLLLEYRNTPVTGINYSPAQLLYSRQLRAKIPTEESLLKPEVCTGVREKLQLTQTNQKHYFDQSTKDLPPLENDESILLRRNGMWEPATVVGKYHTPRSYLVQKQDGTILRRNRKELRKSLNQHPLPSLVLPDLDILNTDDVARPIPVDSEIVEITGSGREHDSTDPDIPNIPNNVLDLPDPTPEYPRPRPKRIIKEPIRFKDYVKR